MSPEPPDEYTFGRRPELYLTLRQVARLTALRGLIQDVRAGHSAGTVYRLHVDDDFTPQLED